MTRSTLSKLDLDPKCQGHSRNQKLMTWGTKNLPPQKNLSRGSLSNWCDADEDAEADSCKTICRPPPYGGVDIIINSIRKNEATIIIKPSIVIKA